MLAPAVLPPSLGWHVAHTRVHACPGVTPARCVQATTWASTVPRRDCIECLPRRTVAGLPPGGIIVKIGVAVEHPTRMPRRAWPPHIRATDVGGGFEGLPETAVFQYGARVRGVEVAVMVFFGRSPPTPGRRARAESLVRAARLP